MKDSARYVKIVEWSDEDGCYVGSSPGLLYGGCHGSEEQQVFEELCQIVEETVELYHQDGRPLPPPTSAATSPTRCKMSPKIPERSANQYMASRDPILDELHAIRRQMLAECGGDLDRLVTSVQEREVESGRMFITLPSGDSAGASTSTT